MENPEISPARLPSELTEDERVFIYLIRHGHLDAEQVFQVLSSLTPRRAPVYPRLASLQIDQSPAQA